MNHDLKSMECSQDNQVLTMIGGERVLVAGQRVYFGRCACGIMMSGDTEQAVYDAYHLHLAEAVDPVCTFCNEAIDPSTAYRVSSADTGAVKLVCPEHIDVSRPPDINFVRQDLVALERELRT